jgi:hypothetical protein
VPTLAEMRLEAQQRADMESSDFVSDAEWRTFLNGSLAELYDLILQHYGADYYVATPYEFTTTTEERYPLPDDFYKLLAVDLEHSGTPSGYVTLKPFNFGERNRFGPIASGRNIVLHYAPRLTLLVNDEDEVDGVSGWEQLAVIDAARKALVKEESDTTAIEREKAALVARIENAAENRDAGSPGTVVDTSGRRWDPEFEPGSEMRYRLNGNKLWLRGGVGWP